MDFTADSISLPSRLDLHSSIHFAERLQKLKPAEQFTFDFSPLRWVNPFGMLHTACTIRRFTSEYSRQIKFRAHARGSTDRDAVKYAAFMGFFKACKFNFGNMPGGQAGDTYVPVTFTKVKTLVAGGIGFSSGVESIAHDLSQQLIQDQAQLLLEPVKYSFRETIRNVIEHSEADEIGYCAQYWPRKNRVEIAIVDTGIGLRRSSSLNPHLDINSDADALKYSLMPGVSGKVYKGIRNDPNNEWQNSGYGLYMNYRLCNEGGDFFICSGDKGLFREVNADDNRYIDTDFQGTILRLRLDTGTLHNYEQLLAKFRHEGSMLARQSDHGANISPNKISSYLRQNFVNLQAGISVGASVQHMQFGIGRVQTIIRSNPENLALVSFRGGRSKRVQISSLILYDDSDGKGIDYSDIPF